ncbi:phage holin family protein [uncultured Anaerococcus sp.]|uniref:phage holin family protein n=1 Tax=uncultured Anaerococcus sp. TaxID=293428 RepID=UPI0025D41BA5|nr:phage holin family protein [uncultured Anaerococcus sp.]
MNRQRKKSFSKKRSNVLLILFIANAISLFLMSKFISHISFEKSSALLITAAVLTLLQKVVEPILRFFAFPVTVLTLGLFSLVISAFVLYLAFKFVEGAYIDSHLFSLVIASIVLSIVSSIVLNVIS